MCAMQYLVYRWASVQRSPAKSGHLGTNRFGVVALKRSAYDYVRYGEREDEVMTEVDDDDVDDDVVRGRCAERWR